MNLYLSASHEAISSMLVREEGKRMQKSMYYSSQVLHNADMRYSKAEKLIYTLVIAIEYLRPYFQAHLVIVLTNQLLKAIVGCPDTLKRMAKSVVRLSEFDITYQPWLVMKVQVLVDFIICGPTMK